MQAPRLLWLLVAVVCLSAGHPAKRKRRTPVKENFTALTSQVAKRLDLLRDRLSAVVKKYVPDEKNAKMAVKDISKNTNLFGQDVRARMKEAEKKILTQKRKEMRRRRARRRNLNGWVRMLPNQPPHYGKKGLMLLNSSKPFVRKIPATSVGANKKEGMNKTPSKVTSVEANGGNDKTNVDKAKPPAAAEALVQKL